MVARLMLTVLLASGLAVAQRGGGGGGMGGGEEGGMGGGGGMGAGAGGGMEGGGAPRAQRQTPAEVFMNKLKLKQDQQEEAVKILSEAVQKARPVITQINQGRQMIATSLLQKKTDEEMKPLMEAFTKVNIQMATMQADAFAKVYALLKPNQQKNAGQAFELMHSIFMPPVQAGGGRGMGRQGGAGVDASKGSGSGRGRN
jgi:hypothetical protein